MGERGVLAEDDEGAITDAAAFTDMLAEGARHLSIRHSWLQTSDSRADRFQRDVVRPLHQRDLGGRFDHSASGGDRSGADELRLGQLRAKSVIYEEAKPLLDADGAGGAAVSQDAGDQAIRTLVLLPGAHVHRIGNE